MSPFPSRTPPTQSQPVPTGVKLKLSITEEVPWDAINALHYQPLLYQLHHTVLDEGRKWLTRANFLHGQSFIIFSSLPFSAFYVHIYLGVCPHTRTELHILLQGLLLCTYLNGTLLTQLRTIATEPTSIPSPALLCEEMQSRCTFNSTTADK